MNIDENINKLAVKMIAKVVSEIIIYTKTEVT